ELNAMRRELPRRLAVLCPAFPANGRTVENGVLSVLGKHLPIPGRQVVREAFEALDDDNAAELPLSLVRQGVDGVCRTFAQMLANGIETVFCDAMTDDDLNLLAQA